MVTEKQQLGAIASGLTDLNEMREVEMILSDQSPGKDEHGDAIPSDRARYRVQLCVVCMGEGGPIHATAQQKVEAFLRTLNLWVSIKDL